MNIYDIALAGAGLGVLIAGGLHLVSRSEYRRFKEEPDKERKRIREVLESTDVIGTLRRLYSADGEDYRTKDGQRVEPHFLGTDVFDIKPGVAPSSPSRLTHLLNQLDQRLHPLSAVNKSPSLDTVLEGIGSRGKDLSANYFLFGEDKEVHGDLVMPVCYLR